MALFKKSLVDIDQVEFDNAEKLVIQLLRGASPQLDLRRGTALRELVVRPAAQVLAFNDSNIEDLRKQSSLKLILEDPDLSVDDEVIDNLLANFMFIRNLGGKATGTAIIRGTLRKDYFIPAGYPFLDPRGNRYVTTQDWVATENLTDSSTQIQIFDEVGDATDFFFLLPLQAEDTGTLFFMEQGTALTFAGQPLEGLTTAEAYVDFGGGVETETAQEALQRLPDSLSHRAFESNFSITARLREELGFLEASSAVGYGDEEQLRDSHNVLGVSVGSRVDIYTRTSRDPFIVTLNKTATKVSDGVYTFDIDAADAPGFYLIRAITLLESTAAGPITSGALPIVGSLNFTEVRSSEDTSSTFHDFDPNNIVIETAFTVFQKSTVTVTDVPAIIEGSSSVFPDTLDMKIEVYAPRALEQIQDFADDDFVRNLESDHLVRGAVPCYVTLNATLFRSANVTLDLDVIRAALVNFINVKNFGDILTTSQLATVMHQFDIIRIGLGDRSDIGFQMEGRVQGADGNLRLITGDVIDISMVSEPESLITPKTVVFFADPRNIFLSERVI
jgi:hypothetical protein